MMQLPKFTMGVGDRFAHQGKAQLSAFLKAKELGVEVCPVWNKSNREHMTIGTQPPSVRAASDAAVKASGWKGAYFVDADHINLGNVEGFIASSDFFTLDVADAIGKPAPDAAIASFVAAMKPYAGTLAISGLSKPITVSVADIERIAKKYLGAVMEAGKIYRHVEKAKGAGNFVTEVSMDETAQPQTPDELFFILAAIAQEKIPAQTIAPKFTGRFNKGVDYVGDVAQFEREFRDDVLVIAHAVKTFGLPANLKLSVHSGSDKFSLYGPIRKALKDFGAGVHLKTAGTTWLEEVIGLAEAGGDGLKLAKEIYREAHAHAEEMCAPYATVIDIDPKKLPTPETVDSWSSSQYVNALRHNQKCAEYNPNFRQLIHVGYKVAAKMGDKYLNALKANEAVVAKNVAENVFERHIKPLFIG